VVVSVACSKPVLLVAPYPGAPAVYWVCEPGGAGAGFALVAGLVTLAGPTWLAGRDGCGHRDGSGRHQAAQHANFLDH
jgi:hypothetical protein